MISVSITLGFSDAIPSLSNDASETRKKINSVPELSIIVAANWSDLPVFDVTPYKDNSAFRSSMTDLDLIDTMQMSYSYYIPEERICKIHTVYPSRTSDFSPIIDDVRYCLFIK